MVGGVGDDQEVLGGEAVGEEVVEDAAMLVAQARVLGSPDRESRNIVGEDALQELGRFGASASTSPMWETSNIPAWVRTARCSSRIPS